MNIRKIIKNNISSTKKMRGKKKDKKGFYLGIASIAVICVSAFFSVVIMGSCAVSSFAMDRYAGIKAAEAMRLTEIGERVGGNRVAKGKISIGKGVYLPHSCRVSKTYVVCE